MNTQDLIRGITRQTARFVADLATVEGGRASLADLGDQLFLDLNDALRQRGVSAKVVADMFGLALRGYQTRVRRLNAQRADSTSTLRQAVLRWLDRCGPASRPELMARFSAEDDTLLRGVIHDLEASGWVERQGRGPAATYAVVERAPDPSAGPAADDVAVRLAINRLSPVATDDLAGAMTLPRPRLEAALGRLAAEGRVEAVDGRWRPVVGEIWVDSAAGFTSAVLDHYQAVCSTLATRITRGRTVDGFPVGGATYRFTIDPDDPLVDEVRGVLADLRARLDALWQRTDSAQNKGDHEIVIYVGQSTGRRPR